MDYIESNKENNEESKDSKDSKDSKYSKDSKDSKDSIDSIDSKDNINIKNNVLYELEKPYLIALKKDEIETILNYKNPTFTVEQLEEAMQKVMDSYAGGIGTNYQFNEKQLELADEKIDEIIKLSNELTALDMHELMFIYELKERLVVCKTVIAHLRARKETRWHSFAENLEYPKRSDEWLKYVNSKRIDGKIHMIFRDLVGEGETYEHRN